VAAAAVEVVHGTEVLAYTAGVDRVLVCVLAGQLVTSGPQEVMVSMTVVLCS